MTHFILFTGHMIDKSDRPAPRFPPSAEISAREAIRLRLERLRSSIKTDLLGIAGGACGGDILFHEVCLELNIPSELYLAIPVPFFENTSVSFAGPAWVDRYDQLTKELPVHILFPEKDSQVENEVWESANRWMLDAALNDGGENMTLLALWDEKKGDGKGGAEHMVRVATEQKATVDIINIHRL